MQKFALISAVLIALVGCQTTTATTATKPVATPTLPQPSSVQIFECENGLVVQVSPAGTDKIELSVANHHNAKAIFSRAVSGSGERYVASQGLFGHGGEWHQKGNMAHFSFVGVHGNTVGVVCQS